MSRVIGVRFQRTGKVHYFDPGELEVELLDQVVVETEKGVKTAWVVIEPSQVVYCEAQGPFGSVLRKATPEDLKQGE